MTGAFCFLYFKVDQMVSCPKQFQEFPEASPGPEREKGSGERPRTQTGVQWSSMKPVETPRQG